MRAIDADALIEFIENRYNITWKDDYEGGIKDACTDIIEKISKMPTIEPEIVRCKDCEYCVPGYITDNDDFIPSRCGRLRQTVRISGDDYCSFGERRTDEGD